MGNGGGVVIVCLWRLFFRDKKNFLYYPFGCRILEEHLKVHFLKGKSSSSPGEDYSELPF